MRADAVWTALPARDQHLLLWLLAGDVVTAQLASLLVYGPLRVAQRRLARLVEYGLLRGFWTASAQRPRGRYAYALTRAARSDLERLQWPEGPPDRPTALPASPPIHQLATHDLLAAFLRAGRPEAGEGLVAWSPERACGQLFGFVRPDALAGVRVGQRTLALFLERDLGTERGEVLADKVRRYRSAFSRVPGDGMAVGFVVESARRAQTIHALGRRHLGGLTLLTAVADQLLLDPLGAAWLDGQLARSIRELVAVAPDDGPILVPGCLLDADALAAFDDRGASTLSALSPYLG
ncbi:MAG: replication-relaxation family protein [Candidatus Limnocylindrales bacterium]